MPAIAVAEDREHGVFPDGLGRQPGEPLSHPRIATSDRARLLRHWEDKKRSSTPRDWGALYMGNPRPVEGALIDREILRKRRCYNPETVPVKHAVAVDPSGGGRDTAGIVAGFLGADRKVYLTHDLSGRMPTEQWAEKACLLAYTTQADRLYVETNYGADMALRVVRAAWKDLIDRGDVPAGTLPPMILPVHARKGKLLRAEPIAAQIILDNVRFAAHMPELEEEWATWMPTSNVSPGRIDASVHMIVGLLPVAGIQAIAGTVSSPVNVSRRIAVGHGDSGMPVIPRGTGAGGARVIPIHPIGQRRGGFRMPG
jgi:hypothetical protein